MGSPFDSTYLECRRHSLNETSIHFQHTMRDGPMYYIHQLVRGVPILSIRGEPSHKAGPRLCRTASHIHTCLEQIREGSTHSNSIYIDRRVVARPGFALAVSSLHLQGEL